MQFTREFYAPKDVEPEVVDDVNAVVYRFETAGKLYAMGFSGKRAKYDFYYRFKSSERREEYINSWLDGLRARKKFKDEQAAERKAFKHGFKEGDILYSSWGYEQTNIDFYQVIKVPSDKTIVIRKIASDLVADDQHSMAGHKTPIKDNFLSDAKPMRKTVQPGNYVRLTSYSSASMWDGKPKRCSWYA